MKKVLCFGAPSNNTPVIICLHERTCVNSFKNIYTTVYRVQLVCVCKCDNNAEEVKRAQTAGYKKKKGKNENLPTTTTTTCSIGQRLSNCPCAYTKPLITINCIVWTATLIYIQYITLYTHISEYMHIRIVYKHKPYIYTHTYIRILYIYIGVRLSMVYA